MPSPTRARSGFKKLSQPLPIRAIIAAGILLLAACGPIPAADAFPAAVNLTPVIDSPILATPNPVTGTSTASLSVSAHDPDNGPSALVFNWTVVGGPGGVNFSANNSTLAHQTNATFGSSGTYTLRVDVSDGLAATSDQIILDVTLTGSGAPVISVQPQSQTIDAGESVVLSVTASGSLPLNYLWERDGAVVGDNSASLQIVNAQAADSGSYTVKVSNADGDVTSTPALLTVTPSLPTITQAPIDQTVSAGGTATFTAAARGTEPLTFSWTHNAAIIGFGATLTLTNVQALDAGPYTVTVSNSVGNTTSSPANLIIGGAGGNPIVSNTAILLFVANPGSTTPLKRDLELINTSNDPITVTLTTTAVWLTINPTTATIAGHNAQTFEVTADPTGKTGLVTSGITVTNSPGGQTRSIGVSLDLTGRHHHHTGASCSLAADSARFDLAALLGLALLAACLRKRPAADRAS